MTGQPTISPAAVRLLGRLKWAAVYAPRQDDRVQALGILGRYLGLYTVTPEEDAADVAFCLRLMAE